MITLVHFLTLSTSNKPSNEQTPFGAQQHLAHILPAGREGDDHAGALPPPTSNSACSHVRQYLITIADTSAGTSDTRSSSRRRRR